MHSKKRIYFKITSIIIITLILLSISIGCELLPREEELLPFDLLQPADVTFITMQPERGTIQNILKDQATAISAVQYNMTFENRSGYLAEMNVTFGSIVEEGDVLARLDTGNLELDIRRQEINIQKIELSIAESRRWGGQRYAIQQATLDLELANLTLQQLTDEYESASIIAPHAGEIVFLGELRIGDYVSARRTVMVLADPTQIMFEYSGQHARMLKYGMEAMIDLDTNLTVPVRVSMTANEAPVEERDRYRDTIIFTPLDQDDIPESVGLGRRFQFSIILEEKDDVIVIPRHVVSLFMNQHYVQILEDGMRVQRDLVVGIVTNQEVEVVRGLTEDDVIITGIER